MSRHIDSTVTTLLSETPDVESEHSPPTGVAIALTTPKLAHACAGGVTGAGTATTLTTVFDLASVTKALGTTTALMCLVSQNLIGLDAPVRQFIPEFSGGQKNDVTLRDLLLHRAGLWEWQPLYLDTTDRAEALKDVAALPLRYARGQKRHYSDLGFMLLGEIVARVAGLSLRRAVRELVTEPLGLDGTSYAPPARSDIAVSSYGDRAEQHMVKTQDPYPVLSASRTFDGWRTHALQGEANDGNTFHSLAGESGHAGLFSTITDLTRYAAAMARTEEWASLFHPDVAREFFAAGPDDGQALGFRRSSFELLGERVTMVGHPGFTGCSVGFVPGEGVGLAMVSNRLLTPSQPISTGDLWESAKSAASTDLKEHLR